MLRIRRKRLFWFGAGLLAVGVSFLVFPPYEAYCESDNANDYYCTAYGVAVALGSVIEAHSGAITALATIFIGLFTYTLKRSTDKMWDASERQIKTTRQIATVEARQMRTSLKQAAESAGIAKEQVEIAKSQIEVAKIGIFDLERAYLAAGPTQIKVDFVASDTARSRGFYMPSDPQELRLKLLIHNTGHTGGTIKKIYGEFSDILPDSPTYESVAPIITDLGIAASVESVLHPFEFQSDFIGQQFFWGYVEYTDIFKKTHTSRFCTHLEPAERGTMGKFQIAGSDPWRECD
jgi:hypothetical protein